MIIITLAFNERAVMMSVPGDYAGGGICYRLLV